MIRKSNVQHELLDIGQMLRRAEVMEQVRREVLTVLHQRRAKVLDGTYAQNYGDRQKYDVVVTDIDGRSGSLVARRLRERMPDMEVDELVKGVLGVRTARRRKKSRVQP